jgi:hypothetical protein
MYKKVTANLTRWRKDGGPRLPIPEKAPERHPVKYGVILRETRGQQEVRLTGRYAQEGLLYLDAVTWAEGAKPGDRVRLFYNRRVSSPEPETMPEKSFWQTWGNPSSEIRISQAGRDVARASIAQSSGWLPF